MGARFAGSNTRGGRHRTVPSTIVECTEWTLLAWDVIIVERLAVHRRNMQAVVEGMAELAEKRP